ncbi:MAG: ATP-binding cassette domain-containing protein [Ardenticatenaceae bacterium]|nr:ATP-binding cassette domain-containing protein [Ardenticatenaceae bacterium]
MDSFITCENLVKIYQLMDDIEVQALQGLDLTVEQGEMVGVIGASGSGKSTLLNVLGGLIRPTGGQVVVNGRPLFKLTSVQLDRYRREEVGFVWQQGARNLIPYLSAIENVEFPMLLAGQSGRKARQQAERLMEMVGLAERRNHQLGSLSGGEQQRVAIAIALANDPSLLLADEPTGELDSVTAQQIYDMFKTFNRELHLTTLIVSHDPGIARHVDRVIAIRDGKLASETVRRERPSDLHSDEHHDDHFEELIVLDSAGRLQIPKAQREELNIRRRVTLEVVPEGILIKPANSEEELRRERPKAGEPSQQKTSSRWQQLLTTWRRSR